MNSVLLLITIYYKFHLDFKQSLLLVVCYSIYIILINGYHGETEEMESLIYGITYIRVSSFDSQINVTHFFGSLKVHTFNQHS